LNLPDLTDMAFRYTVMEFNTAIKADCFLDLIEGKGFDAAIYLDPDIQLFAPLAEVHAALEAGASAVLTPHILMPLPEGAHPGENEIMQSGVFNLGFGAFSKTEESIAFLRWWAGKLHTECYSAPEKGLFVDQRFVDAAPALIEKLTILRHPGYNVAYWNLANRHLEASPSGVRVNGAPLVFFHFSGVDPGKPDVLSKHAGTEGAMPQAEVSNLIRTYIDELAAAGQARWSGVPYAFANFRDGSPVLPPMRRHPPARGTADDWFGAPDLDWWNSADTQVDQKKGMLLTRLMVALWEMRPDLKASFPLSRVAGRRGLYTWFHTHGVREYNIPDTYVSPSMRARLAMFLSRALRFRKGR
jgi:hypothetical protein